MSHAGYGHTPGTNTDTNTDTDTDTATLQRLRRTEAKQSIRFRRTETVQGDLRYTTKASANRSSGTKLWLFSAHWDHMCISLCSCRRTEAKQNIRFRRTETVQGDLRYTTKVSANRSETKYKVSANRNSTGRPALHNKGFGEPKQRNKTLVILCSLEPHVHQPLLMLL